MNILIKFIVNVFNSLTLDIICIKNSIKTIFVQTPFMVFSLSKFTKINFTEIQHFVNLIRPTILY